MKKGFSLAEALITLMIVSLILAAVIPVMSKKQNTVDSMWRYASNNSDIYFANSTSQTAVIGSNTVPASSKGSRIVIVTPKDSSNDTINRSILDFYQTTSTGINNIGRIAFDDPQNYPNASYNVAVGAGTLLKNTTGHTNTAIGSAAMANNTTGCRNTAIGHSSQDHTTEGSYNTSLGSNSLGSANAAILNTGSYNTSIGSSTMRGNTTGYGNTTVGYAGLFTNSTGASNNAIGQYSMNMNTSGNNNVAVGSWALYSNTTGGGDVAIGNGSLYENKTGDLNVGVGIDSLRVLNSGTRNVAIGATALSGVKTGSDNIGIGLHTMLYSEAGNNNTAIGIGAMRDSKIGDHNTGVGWGSMIQRTGGSANVGLGSYTLAGVNSTGNNNTAVGYGAGWGIGGGSGNLCLGYMAGPTSDQNNKLYIDSIQTNTPLIFGDFNSRYVTINPTSGLGPITFGDTTYADMSFTGGSDSWFWFNNTGASNGATSIAYRSTPVFTVYNSGAATWSQGGYSSSDKRWKKNITPLQGSLEKISKLQGVNYYWKKKEFPKMPFNNKKQIGLIAQEVEKVYPELIFTTNDGYKYVDYGKLAPILIEGMKEIYHKLTAITLRVTNLENKISKLEKENKELKQKLSNQSIEIKDINKKLAKAGIK